MDTGLGMKGGTDGHRTRDGRWDRWTQDYRWKVGQMDTGLVMEGGTDGHRTSDGRWDSWTQD